MMKAFGYHDEEVDDNNENVERPEEGRYVQVSARVEVLFGPS